MKQFLLLWLCALNLIYAYKIELVPTLCPQYRPGIPTLFQLHITATSSSPLPTNGELTAYLNINGFLFSKTISLSFPVDTTTIEIPIEAIIPPRLKSCQVILSGSSSSLSYQTTIPLPKTLSSRMRLGALQTSPSQHSFWKSLLKNPRNNLYSLALSDIPDFQFLNHFDYLIFERTTPLPPQTQKAIHSWLQWGGTLIGNETLLEQTEFASLFPTQKFPAQKLFQLKQTLGDQAKWEQWGIKIKEDVGWFNENPAFISISYGIGKIILVDKKIPFAKNLQEKLFPLLFRKTPSIFSPNNFIPFSIEPKPPLFLKKIIIGSLFLYFFTLCLLGWKTRKTIPKKYLKFNVIFFILFTGIVYFLWGKSPIIFQELNVKWISNQGVSQSQRLIHLTSLRKQLYSISNSSAKQKSLILPQFYENRDFKYKAQQKLKADELLNSPIKFWNFQLISSKLNNIPLQADWNYIFEQKSSLYEPATTLTLAEDGKLHNKTNQDFHHLLLYQKGNWGYIESLNSGNVTPIPWNKISKEKLSTKFPPSYARTLEFILKSKPGANVIVAFPKIQPQSFHPLKGLSHPTVSVTVYF